MSTIACFSTKVPALVFRCVANFFVNVWGKLLNIFLFIHVIRGCALSVYQIFILSTKHENFHQQKYKTFSKTNFELVTERILMTFRMSIQIESEHVENWKPILGTVIWFVCDGTKTLTNLLQEILVRTCDNTCQIMLVFKF